MRRDWTQEEIRTASVAMEAIGELGYDDFCIMLKIAEFAKVQREGFFPCPRCGHYRMDSDPIRNALSRSAQVQVCDECGTDEALRDFAGIALPLKDWAIAISPELFVVQVEVSSSPATE